jgi:flagellar basal body-associated protein FliL
MKKNILTIIIMAISLINTILIAILIFTIIPAASKSMKLIDKVASIVDLELESPNPADDITVDDIQNYPFTDAIQCGLKSDDGKDHYISVVVTLQENMKNEDYERLTETVSLNENPLKEIIEDEFAKYTRQEVKDQATKDKIKAELLSSIQEYFDSDFIINVTLSNYLIE